MQVCELEEECVKGHRLRKSHTKDGLNQNRAFGVWVSAHRLRCFHAYDSNSDCGSKATESAVNAATYAFCYRLSGFGGLRCFLCLC